MSMPTAAGTLRRLGELSPEAASRFTSLVFLDRVVSTNDVAFSHLEQRGSEADGTVVVAREQSGGRGRMGRSWSSPSGNLHLSVLRRIVEPPDKCAMVSLLSGIAMAEAVIAVTGVKVTLKWPNDLLVGDLKLAGILLEGRDGFQVVGIGVNVNVHCRDLAPEVHATATTLLDQRGRHTDHEELLAVFLERFAGLEAAFVEAPTLPRERYLRYFPFVGQPVRVQRHGQEVVAPVAGIGADGALLLAGDGGETMRITTGEVTHVRRA